MRLSSLDPRRSGAHHDIVSIRKITGGSTCGDNLGQQHVIVNMVESAVGAHLCNTSDANTLIHYWRDGPLEVDFVIRRGKRLAAIEVKSGRAAASKPGLDEFCRRHRGCRRWVVGDKNLPVGEFLRYPANHWVD